MKGGCKCEICSKSFSNRQALWGHMRSHFVFLPISPKPETSADSKAQRKTNQPSTSGLADKRYLKRCALVDNSNYTSQPVIDQTCSLSRSDSNSLPDRNIIKISLENPSCCKSKEVQGSEFPRVPMSLKESTGMLSVTSSNEDVAHALVDLSKGRVSDQRRKQNKGKRKIDAHRGGNGDREERKDYDGAHESRNDDDNNDQTHTKEQMVVEDKGGNTMTMYQCSSSSSNSPSDIPSSSIPAEPIECKKQLPDLNLPPPDEDDEN